jgi:hypothetical protein
MDNSIIDVAGESFSLSNLSSNNSAIHYWANKPVYSYSEIKSATNAQRVYYKTFKFNFLGVSMQIYKGMTTMHLFCFMIF